MISLTMKNKSALIATIALLVFASCKEHKNKTIAIEQPQVKVTKASLIKEGLYPKSGAAFCRPTGLKRSDSALYMNGGGGDFMETISNPVPKEVSTPVGMKYIPGGEFSMGGVNPVGMEGGGHEDMDDARPVHQVKGSPF